MKKVFALLMLAGMFSFVACGPKAEEKTEETTTVTNETTPATETATTDSAAVTTPAPATETTPEHK